jgi:hypothetical protein
MSYISVDVDIDDIISDMGRYERRKFFEAMKDEGYISDTCIVTNEGEVKAPDHIERNAKYEATNEFNLALRKLLGNGWRVTLEEEEYIINLSKRF